MPKIPLSIPGAEGLALNCAVDDYLWPWQRPTPVLMMHGFARNARFWNRWVPSVADSYRAYRPELPGCGDSPAPPSPYHPTPQTIRAHLIRLLHPLDLH